jgi:F-type H+-transporting ATPase subunit gamma
VIADALMEKFVSGDYDKIELIYNHLKNAATQIVQTSNSYL